MKKYINDNAEDTSFLLHDFSLFIDNKETKKFDDGDTREITFDSIDDDGSQIFETTGDTKIYGHDDIFFYVVYQYLEIIVVSKTGNRDKEDVTKSANYQKNGGNDINLKFEG